MPTRRCRRSTRWKRLSYEEKLLEREQYLQVATAENNKPYDLTLKQYEIGNISLAEVLPVQDKWIQSKIALTNVSVQRLLNRVGLHLALGGSFE